MIASNFKGFEVRSENLCFELKRVDHLKFWTFGFQRGALLIWLGPRNLLK